MLRCAAWLHFMLAGYLWLIAWIPRGNWNRQREPLLLASLLNGKGLDAADLGMLAFVTAPAFLFCWAWRRCAVWPGVAALVIDAAWLYMQIQSWWRPYVFGTNVRWQLDYAQGPTTKLLPSFGNHVAPDAMHLVIHILLVAAMITGVIALRRIKSDDAYQVPDGR